MLRSGKTSATARIIDDLPVPLGPVNKTPPILGSIAFKSNVVLNASCPTNAENGKMGRIISSVITVTVQRRLLAYRHANHVHPKLELRFELLCHIGGVRDI